MQVTYLFFRDAAAEEAPLGMPTARTVESVGEWWSIRILRDAFQGCTRFGEFQRSLGIAPNILASRLKHLTAQGLFERRLYRKKPKWYDACVLKKVATFFPLLWRCLPGAANIFLLTERLC
jgi:DNA-binding HxlR family transcriptional regulator